jgi:hypothetical protein
MPATQSDLLPGNELLHFNPSTGRIVRCVKVIEVRGEAVIVESLNGKNKGKRYPVSLNCLAK